MFKKILVPTDGSGLADIAASAAIKFAKEIGATIVAISVAEPAPNTVLSEGGAFVVNMAEYEEKARELAQKHVDQVAAEARLENVPCETVTALSFSPYQEIINAANAHDCDVIFMSSHGRRGVDKLLLGSQTQKVLAHSTIPVLVFRHRET